MPDKQPTTSSIQPAAADKSVSPSVAPIVKVRTLSRSQRAETGEIWNLYHAPLLWRESASHTSGRHKSALMMLVLQACCHLYLGVPPVPNFDRERKR